ncbi:MAG: hypothetical protein H6661_10095 [Ardenticatenaceae bacterium]|nr:hypothetical protein [Ardenticatenaceae bacterium]
MGTKRGKVNWYAEDVMLKFTKLSERALEAAAFRVEYWAKININTNDQIDTGFMANSVYVVTEEGSSYAATMSNGAYPWRPQKHGGVTGVAQREMAPEAPLPDGKAALVCVGANYAIFQEQQQPFLYPALLAVKSEMKGIIETVAKDG